VINYLYILKSLKVYKYYTGISDNPHRRIIYHNTTKKGFTSRYRPWELVYTEKFNSRAEALAAEKKVKNWKSRVMIEKLIAGEIKL
jgi:putative endonuclease